MNLKQFISERVNDEAYIKVACNRANVNISDVLDKEVDLRMTMKTTDQYALSVGGDTFLMFKRAHAWDDEYTYRDCRGNNINPN